MGKLLEQDFAVVLLDVAMPGMDGLETARLARQRPRNKHLPIIFITAHKDEFVRVRLLREGAVECLFKPFSDTALLAALEAAVRTDRSGP